MSLGSNPSRGTNLKIKIMEFMVGCLIVLIIIVIALAIGPLIIMWAWNLVMPYLFGLPEINFWMALAISVLTSLLFRKTITNNVKKG